MEWLPVATSKVSTRNNADRVAILYFQIFYRTMVIKRDSTKTQMWVHVATTIWCLTKMPKAHTGRQHYLQPMVLEKLDVHIKKNKIESYLLLCTKISTNVKQDSNVKPQALTLLEENIDSVL